MFLDRQPLDDAVGRRRWPARQNRVVQRDVNGACVCPSSAVLAKRFDLEGELVWRPQIVVVQEGDPLAVRLGDTVITGGAHTLGTLVTHHSHAWITETREHRLRIVSGPVVDDDDLEIDLALPQDAPQAHRNQLAAVVRRDDDRDFRHVRARFRTCGGCLASSELEK